MDLARRVGLNKSTVSRFVATLTQVGLLERVEGSKRIRLGLRVFELGSLAVAQHPLVQRAQPILDRLSAQVRETVTLFAPVEHDAVLVVGRREGGGDGPARGPTLGRRYPRVLAAAGIAVLAGDPEYSRSLSSEGDCCAGWRAEIRRVQSLGFASVEGDPEPDLHSLAAPVRDRTGGVVAAIAVSTSRTRMPAAIPALSAPLCRAAADLSRRLGFHRGELPLRSLAEVPQDLSVRSA